MQNTDKKPTASQLGKITDFIIELHESLGLREFQEAIHYAIGQLAMIEDDEEQIIAEEKKNNVQYLMFLASSLRKMEVILPPFNPSGNA